MTLFCSPVPLCKCSIFANAVAVLCQNSLVGINSMQEHVWFSFCVFPPILEKKDAIFFPSGGFTFNEMLQSAV